MRFFKSAQSIGSVRYLHIFALIVFATTPLSQLVAQTHVSNMFVIEDVSVVDVVNEQILTSRTVVIADSRIVSVSDARETAIPAEMVSIDGTGLYLTPGLIDAHVHLEETDLPLYIANGVTTVIEMNGSPEKLEFRSRVAKGELVGPRIYMASPLLAGTTQNFSFQLIENPEQARQAVLQIRELGYDFIKVYDGLSLETYNSLVESADEFEIPILGHIPASVNIQRTLTDNFKSIEHVEQIARSTVGHNFDESQIPDIVSQLRAGTSAVTPTLAAMEILNSRRTSWFDSLFERDEMRYTPNSVADWWQSMRVIESARNDLTDSSPGGTSASIGFYRTLTRALHEGGVLLLSGTDTPNPLLVPGFALHHELQALSRAGISNSAILRMATSNAAKHLAAESEFGVIKVGMRAELILLRENPLANLSALRSIEGVILGNRYFDKTALEDLLER